MKQAIEQAKKEIEEEKFRDLVEKEKQKLKWPFWKKLFPFKIKIKVIDLRKEK